MTKPHVFFDGFDGLFFGEGFLAEQTEEPADRLIDVIREEFFAPYFAFVCDAFKSAFSAFDNFTGFEMDESEFGL